MLETAVASGDASARIVEHEERRENLSPSVNLVRISVHQAFRLHKALALSSTKASVLTSEVGELNTWSPHITYRATTQHDDGIVHYALSREYTMVIACGWVTRHNRLHRW